MTGSMACEYVSSCTKVPAGARGLHTRMPQEKEDGEEIFGKGTTAKTSRGSLSVQPSNRKNVITKGIKVRETTSVTRLCRFRRRPDAEFKYRRKYSAFDSRNCCIRHLSPLTLPLKDSFAAVAFSSFGC